MVETSSSIRFLKPFLFIALYGTNAAYNGFGIWFTCHEKASRNGHQ